MSRFATFALAALPLVALAPLAGCASTAQAPSGGAALAQAIAAPGRTPANVARDRYRHPAETLAFFGVRPADTVVEIWPAGGWYSEILAPYLRPAGTLWLAGPVDRAQALAGRLSEQAPSLRVAAFPATEAAQPRVPDGSADVVLTFRNVHNWRFGGVDQARARFEEMYRMLKPGGTLGVVEHRLPEGMASAMEEKSGYMKRSSVVGFAEAAGFRLVDESDVNANPADTHDYARGVWTLPPTFREGDSDRARYAAIGESDRMTLRFRKPG